MQKLFSNIRFYVVLTSLLFSLAIYIYIIRVIPSGSLQTIRLTQVYALVAVSYLYIVILAGPLCFTFRFLPFRGIYLKARRGLGVSVFYFGFLHAYFAFFYQLGGFAGLGFLSNKYLLAILLSFTALIILSLMTATSFDYVIATLTYPKWKFLHRFVYVAGILILIHALMLGTHFQNLVSFIPQLSYILIGFLLLLEALRIDAWLQKRFIKLPKFGLALVIMLIVISIGARYVVIPEASFSLGIHSQHIQLAKDAQNQNSQYYPQIPGFQGDRTKRFSVNFNHPDIILSNQDTPLLFQVFDASNGNQVQFFSKPYEKVVHLVIVNDSLTYFRHIHPDQTEKGFVITTQFPQEGGYHLYLDFQPLGAIEQQFAFTITVGQTLQLTSSSLDTGLTHIFGQYEVTLSHPEPLIATDMAIGNQTMTFTIKDASTKQGITTLKPYLAAFGHMVMINKDSFEYLHVHPSNLVAPPSGANGGPSVDFLPLGLYGPIKPGTYRVFAEFNPDNHLFTADFTVVVK